MKKFKTIYFVKAKKNWLCKDISEHDLIGTIVFQAHKNRKSAYYFLPADTEDSYLNSICLKEISQFLNQLNKKEKAWHRITK